MYMYIYMCVYVYVMLCYIYMCVYVCVCALYHAYLIPDIFLNIHEAAWGLEFRQTFTYQIEA